MGLRDILFNNKKKDEVIDKNISMSQYLDKTNALKMNDNINLQEKIKHQQKIYEEALRSTRNNQQRQELQQKYEQDIRYYQQQIRKNEISSSQANEIQDFAIKSLIENANKQIDNLFAEKENPIDIIEGYKEVVTTLAKKINIVYKDDEKTKRIIDEFRQTTKDRLADKIQILKEKALQETNQPIKEQETTTLPQESKEEILNKCEILFNEYKEKLDKSDKFRKPAVKGTYKRKLEIITKNYPDIKEEYNKKIEEFFKEQNDNKKQAELQEMMAEVEALEQQEENSKTVSM